MIISNAPTKKLDSDTKFVKAIVSSSYLLALDEEGHMWAQGANGDGQLGNGTTNYSSSLILVIPNKIFIDVDASGYTSYALDTEGNVWAWGLNSSCYFGNGSNENSSIPVKVNIPTKVKNITKTYALDENNNAWFWGPNYGYSGDGTNTSVCTPIKIG